MAHGRDALQQDGVKLARAGVQPPDAAVVRDAEQARVCSQAPCPPVPHQRHITCVSLVLQELLHAAPAVVNSCDYKCEQALLAVIMCCSRVSITH